MANSTADQAAPPRDSVWTKYSPNHEFPLASATSFALHGLIVAAVLLSGLALQARWHGEASAPPKLDVGLVEAPKGDGQVPGGGREAGTPGNSTEQVEPKEAAKSAFDKTLPLPLDTIAPAPFQIRSDLPTIEITQKTPSLDKTFDALQNDLKVKPDPKPIKVTRIGDGGANGKGGQGKGTNTGIGDSDGPGNGIGGPLGDGSATRAQILAGRWRFNPSGSPRDHVQKLMAAGIIVGFKDGNDYFYLIHDLKKRPVDFQKEPFEKYKDTVKWFSQDPRSVLGLYQELRLPGPPVHFVLLLPKDREQKLADAELKYAAGKGRDLKGVEETWFDFRAVGGAFEPVVVGQTPFEPRPKW